MIATQHTATSYVPPPLPLNEDQRAAALQALKLNRSFDPVLDSLCKLLCSLINVPISGVLIVDQDSQYFIASTGRNGTPGTVPRSESICQYTFLPRLPSIFVVEDFLEDPRFVQHPLALGTAEEAPVRFFAAAPLITSEGYRIGALCLLDGVPRTLTIGQYGVLSNCAEMVMRRLEKDHFLTLHRKRTGNLLRTLDALSTGIMLCDTGNRGWPILHINEDWTKQTGLKMHEVLNHTVWDVFCAAPESQDTVERGFMDLISQAEPFILDMQLRAKGSDAPVLKLLFQPAKVGSLGPAIQIPDSLPTVDGPHKEMPYYFVLVSGKEPEGMRLSSESHRGEGAFKPGSPQAGLSGAGSSGELTRGYGPSGVAGSTGGGGFPGGKGSTNQGQGRGTPPRSPSASPEAGATGGAAALPGRPRSPAEGFAKTFKRILTNKKDKLPGEQS